MRPEPPPEREPSRDEPREPEAPSASRSIPLEEARRLEWERNIRPDPARVADGWERRFLADPARAREATELYEQLGFEVAADPVRAEDLTDDCADCRLIAAIGFRVIYTRRKR